MLFAIHIYTYLSAYLLRTICLYFFIYLFPQIVFRRKAMGDLRADPLKKIAVLGLLTGKMHYPSTAGNLLELDYPAELYTVFIIAIFQQETVEQLRLCLCGVEVSFDKSTRQIVNEAFRRIGQSYDIALICDADNMLAGNF